MGPPGQQAAFHQRDRGAPGALDLVARGGRLAATFDHRHALAVDRVATDRGGDLPLHLGRQAPGERQVGAVEITRGEGFGQGAVGPVRLRHDHDARGVLVEPMDNARPLFATDARQVVPRMGQQRIDQRAVQIARRRMHDEARGLVQHDQVGILEQDGQGNVLRLRRGGRRRRDVQAVERAGAHRFGRVLDQEAVAARLAGLDQCLDAGARERTYRVSEEAVGTHAGGLGRCRDFGIGGFGWRGG